MSLVFLFVMELLHSYKIFWFDYLFLVTMHLQGCEREVAGAQNGSSDEFLKECIMRLSWALVHSRFPEDVQRGIAMLEGEHKYLN